MYKITILSYYYYYYYYYYCHLNKQLTLKKDTRLTDDYDSIDESLNQKERSKFS